MRLALLNQFYPPDAAPTGRYLHDVARALVAAGHEVTVFASRTSYAGGGGYAAHERLDDVTVVRLAGLSLGRERSLSKALDYAAYCARLLPALLAQRRPDVVVALTTPPFLGLLAKLGAGLRGSRHAHWVMDVYPDVLQAADVLDGPALRTLEALARRAYSGAAVVVTLGPGMAARLSPYVHAPTQLAWVPLWSPQGIAPWDTPTQPPLRAERGWDDGRAVLLYSGNMGQGHRFEEFLGAVECLGPSGPRWAFAGAGKARARIEAFVQAHPELPIEVLPYVPEARLREHLCSADVHLVSIDARFAGMLSPSKLQASFALGKPVIFVGAPDHDAARWVVESGGGWCVGEGDVAGLVAAVRAASDPAEMTRRGALALEHARREFDATRNVQRMVELFTAAGRGRRDAADLGG